MSISRKITLKPGSNFLPTEQEKLDMRTTLEAASTAEVAAAVSAAETAQDAADTAQDAADTAQVAADAAATSAVQRLLISDVVDDLTTGGTSKALSAEMGKSLKTLIDNVEVIGGEQNADEVKLSAGFDEFDTDNTVQDVLESFFYVAPDVSSLSSNTIGSVVLVDTPMADPSFSWAETGAPDGPADMTLDDGAANLIVAQAVSGGSYDATGVTYTLNTAGTVTWTLNSSNAGSTSMTKRWVYPSYTGKQTSATPPIAGVIKTGDVHAVYVSSSFTALLDTTPSDYGWFAVPATANDFENWSLIPPNGDAIGVGKFIYQVAGVVDIDGVDYDLYMFSWASETTTAITLS